MKYLFLLLLVSTGCAGMAQRYNQSEAQERQEIRESGSCGAGQEMRGLCKRPKLDYACMSNCQYERGLCEKRCSY